MTDQRLEGRLTMYVAMAIYVHETAHIWHGLFTVSIVALCVAAALWGPR